MNSHLAPRPRAALVACLGLLLALGSLVPTPAPPAAAAAAADGRGIEGVVRVDGTGSGNGFLEIVDVDEPGTPNGRNLRRVRADGSFSIDLEPGSYWVRFSADQRVAPEWWGDAVSRGTSTQVVVGETGYTKLEVDLEPGGTITGAAPQAAREGSSSGSFAEAWAVDPSRPGGLELAKRTTVGADGTYQLPSLHTGDYLVRIHTNSGSRLEGWWGDATTTATSARDAGPVTVTAPATTGGVVLADLQEQGVIAGRITRADGPALSGTSVFVRVRGDDGTWQQRDFRFTDSAGRYAVAVPSGAYRLFFAFGDAPVQVPVRPEYWGDSPTAAGARTATVEVGGRVTADAVLEPTAVVRLVTPVAVGTREIGRTLTVRSRFYPASSSISYQWLSGGRRVAGATGPTYRLTARDVERRVDVIVVARRAGYDLSRTVVDAGSVPVQDVTPLRDPRIRGRLAVGSTLRVEAPRTDPQVGVRVQWLRGGSAVRGATRSTYRLTRADRDEYVGVLVTSRRAGYRPYVWRVTAPDAVR